MIINNQFYQAARRKQIADYRVNKTTCLDIIKIWHSSDTHDFLIIYNEISFSVNFFSVTDIIYLMDRNFHRLLYYELLFIKHITFEMMDRIRMLMMMTVMKYLFQYSINIDRQHA